MAEHLLEVENLKMYFKWCVPPQDILCESGG